MKELGHFAYPSSINNTNEDYWRRLTGVQSIIERAGWVLDGEKIIVEAAIEMDKGNGEKWVRYIQLTTLCKKDSV